MRRPGPGRARRSPSRAANRSPSTRPGSRRGVDARAIAAVARSWIQEILEQARPLGRQHALRMKLDAFDVELPVTYAHDLAVRRACRNDELARHLLAVGRERVITADLERIREGAIQRRAVVLH